MKLLHIADLHLGKRIGEYPMLEDQRRILEEIVDIAVAQHVSAVLVAGDIYDRPVPPQEATALLSDFLCRFAALSIPVFMISGNHDSAERLSFCAELLEGGGVYVAGFPEGSAKTVVLQDEGGSVAIHMLSHARPAALRPYLGEEAATAEQAMRALIARIDFDTAERHVLLAHAFVRGGETSESEQIVVGTVEDIPACVFEPFDYVALGHLHRPQSIGERVRYAGSPLCYSFSEMNTPKSVTLVELEDNVRIETVALHPLRPMREVRGSFAELMQMNYSEDYIRAVVTDEEVAPDAQLSLRTVFPNMMRYMVDNSRTRYEEIIGEAESVSERNPLDLFAEFYEQQNGVAPDEARLSLMRELLGEEGER